MSERPTFLLDISNAFQKFASNVTVSVNVRDYINISKTTDPNDRLKYAYRNCVRCKVHKNWHINGKYCRSLKETRHIRKYGCLPDE